MDFHRGVKLKQGETTKYHRLPSPMTYITNYNKICSEENEQTKQCLPIDRKHNSLFLWNDGYVQLNRIKVPNVMQERKNKRKIFQQNNLPSSQMTVPSSNNNYSNTHIQSGNINNFFGKDSQQKIYSLNTNSNNNNNVMTNNGIDDDNIEQLRNQKHQREKYQEEQMQKRTDDLIRVMEDNNQKYNTIKRDRENVMLIDNNQRKYFSHTKQQMLELKNHILGSQKISREIMDRKGLSLRKVLSSIPQDKLMQIIDYKQYHFQKIMNEKILPKKEFRLKSVLSPKFTGEHNYDFNKTTSSKFFHNNVNHDNNQFMPSSLKNLNKPQSQQQLTRNNFKDKQNNLERKQSHYQHDLQQQLNQDQLLLTKNSSNINNKQKGSILEKKGSMIENINLNKQISMNNKLMKSSSMVNDKLMLNKQASQISRGGQNTQKSNKNKNKNSNEFDYFMDHFNEDDDDQNQNNNINDMIQQEKKKELRIKSTNEVSSTITKLNQIQEQCTKLQENEQNQLKIPPELLKEMMNITYKPKTSLCKILQHDDEMERQLFIQSLENTQKHNEKKNFFNYSNYFYGKYSKQNNGLSTKLSSNIIKENEKFHQNLQSLINDVDQDAIKNSH